MRRRTGRESGMLSNPILIGALTVLAAIVAVTLAYQANNGLPFVPKYTLYLQMRNASEVTRNAEVHMGGALVGTVTKVTPVRDSAGNPVALLTLSLHKDVEPLPADSTFDVRLKGAIGLKYIDLTKGTSTRTYANNATVPFGQAHAEVDLDQVLSMFDPATRAGVRGSTIGFSDALASRGSDINDAIGAFKPLLRDLLPVATNLSSSKTDLGGFFRGLEAFSGALTPVAQAQADLYVNLDTTFRALAPVAVPFLQNWISETPPTFQTVISDSPSLQSFLLNTAGFFGELRPGFATLNQSAPVLADAFAAGTKNLPGTTELNAQLLSLAQHLQTYSATPQVNAGLDRLTLTLQSLRSPLSFLTPVQATCNYVSLFLRNTGSAISEPFGNGTALRFNSVVEDDVLGGEAVPSSKPYTTLNTHDPLYNGHAGPIHVNPYPYTASPGQPQVCAAGNEPYSLGRGDRQPSGQDPRGHREDDEAEGMRRRKPRVSNFAAGVIAAVVIATVCYFVFGGSPPWAATPFQLKAVFTSQTQLHIPSPVRIAGVDVGQVTSVTRVGGSSSQDAVVTMSINPNGLPIHADATAKIRPRIFLEGNFYVDLRPGSPSARNLGSGATLSVGQTAGPVQLDRVLSALSSSSRTNLETLLRGFGASLDAPPTAAQDASQDPLVRGQTGGEALNTSLNYSADAFQASAMVNQALLGVQPQDLSGAVRGNAEVFRALAASGGQLSSFVSTFNATMAALAARQTELSQTIALLPPFLQKTETSDTALDASFGPTKQFARALTPGISKLGPAIDAGIPWIAQATALMSPQELGGLVRNLTPAIQNTGATISETEALLNQADLLTRCFDHNIVPAGNEVIADPPIGTGQPVYRELFQSAVGLASAPPRTSTATGGISAPTPAAATSGSPPPGPWAAAAPRTAAASCRCSARGRLSPAVRRRCDATSRATATACPRSTTSRRGRAREARDRSSPQRLHRDPRARRARGRRRRVHPRPPALVHARQELLHGQGRVRDGRGGDGRAGAVG